MSFHIFLESMKIRQKESFLLILQCILVFGLVIAAGNLISVNKEKNTYKSIQVNDNFLRHFSIKTSQGELFSKEDYEYHGDVMPVLLGSKYHGVFELHEKVRLEYLGYVFDCEVKVCCKSYTVYVTVQPRTFHLE